MPDDLLGPLGDEPVPPLAPGALLRARGEQRTRRRRAVLAGAAAFAVLAGGLALTDPRGTDELRPAPLATSAPEEQDPLFAALLGPQEVARVLPGAWDDLPDESPFAVPLDGCSAATVPEAGTTAARFLTDGGRIVGQALSRHADAAAAVEEYQQVLASLRACGESSPTYRLLGEGGDSSTRTYGELLTAGEAARPFSLERVGHVLVTLVLQGPAEPSPELTEAAAERVREVLGEAPEPEPSAAPVTEDQLLDGRTLEQVAGGSWTADGDVRQELYPGTYACPEGVTPASAGLVRSLRSADDQDVGSQVLRYPGVEAARKMLDAMRNDVRRCPSRPEDSEDGRASVSHELVELTGSGPDRFYVRVTSRDCDDCPARISLVAVAQADEHLVLVGTSALQGALPRLADAAVARAHGRSRPSGAEGVDVLLLTAEDAAEAEPGTWRVSNQDGADPKLLDPCTGGTRYPRDADRVDTAATAMGSVREAGGTSLTQTLARYPDAAAARDAAEGYERAVRGCPQEEGGEEIPGSRRSHEVVEEDSELRGVRTLYVRSEGGCETCVPDYRYYAVQQVDDLVSVLVVTVGEDGDPGVELVRPFAEQVARRLTS